MKNNKFWTNYEKWYSAAKEEFENGKHYDDSYGINFEIMDDGSLYLGGNLFHVIKNAVTSWSESEFYVD